MSDWWQEKSEMPWWNETIEYCKENNINVTKELANLFLMLYSKGAINGFNAGKAK